MSSAHLRMGNKVEVRPVFQANYHASEEDLKRARAREPSEDEVSMYRDGAVLYFRSWAALWETSSDKNHVLHPQQFYMQENQDWLHPKPYQRIRVTLRDDCSMPVFELVPTVRAQAGSYVAAILGVIAFFVYVYVAKA